MMLEWLALSIGVVAVYTHRADFEKYSIFTVGVFKRVSRDVVETEHECHDTHCEATTSPGERRRWYREIVVGGMPLLRFGGGTHYYCEDHVAFEIHDELDSPHQTTVERLAMSIVEAIVTFGEWKFEPSDTDDSPFADAQSDVYTGLNNAVNLFPIILLVLITAIIIGTMRRISQT